MIMCSDKEWNVVVRFYVKSLWLSAYFMYDLFFRNVKYRIYWNDVKQIERWFRFFEMLSDKLPERTTVFYVAYHHSR